MRILTKLLFWFALNSIALIALVGVNLAGANFTKAVSWPIIDTVATSLLTGGVISFVFYFLVVHLPERRKRRIVKSNLSSMYHQLKSDIAYQIIYASQQGGRSDIQANQETVNQLMTSEGFREYFEGGKESTEGFKAFRNYIGRDVPEYREIVISLKTLAKQIDFVLYNYSIDDQEIFDFFKRLEKFLLHVEAINPGYEAEKILSNFIWEIYTGWNSIDGYLGYDPVDKMIKEI